jgi:glycosyltransferase involved in cell wall biosynthesis
MARLNILFVGRLEYDTGVKNFLEWLDGLRDYKVVFVGDGSLRSKCEVYGTVHGFIDSASFYRKADVCVPAGYLSYIEALKHRCRIKVFPNNQLKKDYWEEILKVKTFPSWDEIADEYISLYNRIK